LRAGKQQVKLRMAIGRVAQEGLTWKRVSVAAIGLKNANGLAFVVPEEVWSSGDDCDATQNIMPPVAIASADNTSATGEAPSRPWDGEAGSSDDYDESEYSVSLEPASARPAVKVKPSWRAARATRLEEEKVRAAAEMKARAEALAGTLRRQAQPLPRQTGGAEVQPVFPRARTPAGTAYSGAPAPVISGMCKLALPAVADSTMHRVRSPCTNHSAA
jgi:hypothetical protein